MKPSNAVRIFYLSHATPELYAMIHQHMPAGYELVTLARNDDGERRARIADCEVVIVAGHRFDAGMIDAARRLRLVVHQGISA